MAIEFDAVATPVDFDTANPVITDLTVGANAKIVIVHVMNKNNTPVSSVTRDGENFTFLRADYIAGSTRVETWYYVNPSSGTKNIAITINACEGIACALSLTGVDPFSPIGTTNGTTGTSDSPSVTITTQFNDSWIVSLVGAYKENSGITEDPSQTQRWELLVGGAPAGRKGAEGDTELKATAGAETQSWTLASGSQDWACHAIEIRVLGVIAKDFSDAGSGLDTFVNPFRAMDFEDVGSGADVFVNPFRAMGFSDVGSGIEVFTTPFRAMGFSDVGGGIDVFFLLQEKQFSDVGSGLDIFVVPYVELGFSDVGSAADVFALVYREVVFSDSGSGVEVFVIFKELMFSDAGTGVDTFLKAVAGVTEVSFSDAGSGVDIFKLGPKTKIFIRVGDIYIQLTGD